MKECKFIYIYSENFDFCDYGKIGREKGDLIFKILDVNLVFGQSFIENSKFVYLKEELEKKLNSLLLENENNFMEYPSNINDFDRFITKTVFGKELKLFQGGIELLIITLSNLLDLINVAIKERHKTIRVLCFENVMEYREFLKSSDGASM